MSINTNKLQRKRSTSLQQKFIAVLGPPDKCSLFNEGKITFNLGSSSKSLEIIQFGDSHSDTILRNYYCHIYMILHTEYLHQSKTLLFCCRRKKITALNGFLQFLNQ